MKLLFVAFEKSRDELIRFLVVVQIGHHSQIGMKGLGFLVVQRVEEVDSVLVRLVRKVGEESLLDQIAHLGTCHGWRIRL